jgi:hypothetical protein
MTKKNKSFKEKFDDLYFYSLAITYFALVILYNVKEGVKSEFKKRKK